MNWDFQSKSKRTYENKMTHSALTGVSQPAEVSKIKKIMHFGGC